MIPHKSMIKHDPPNSYGDCSRACIASILDIEDPNTVPHFCEDGDNGEAADKRLDFFLQDFGFYKFSVPLQAATVEEALKFAAAYTDGHHYIFSGTSRTGCCHSVVCKGEEIVNDPAGTGIVSDYEGFFWIGVLASRT